MTAPLAGLVVVETEGDVATRYCGKMFAEHGARVIQLYRPDDALLGYGGAAGAAYAVWLDAGKERLDRLPVGLVADVVIAGQTGAAVARAADIPAAVRLGLTWFDPAGPYGAWQGSDGIIQALSGAAFAFGPVAGPPTLPQGHAAQVVGGVTAFIAAMGGLIGRRGGRRVARIDCNIFEAYLCLTEGGPPSIFAFGGTSVRRGINRFGPVYPQTIFATADGWIGVSALTPQQWQTLCALIGLPDLGRDPAYETTDLRLAAADALDAILMPAFRKMNAADLLARGQAQRVPLAPVPRLAELLETPHWRERGSFRRYGAAEGPVMPFRIAASGDGVPDHAMGAGDGPLAGVRVLDLSMGWSGPLCGRHFADMGAEVIKIEGTAHLDWWRGWNALAEGDPPPHETRPNFNAVNRNKRGITLDLRDPRGVALMKRFAAVSDVLIENYAPGVLDRLGLGAGVLRGVNPGLCYISMGAFGSAGPWSGFRAYGSTTEQACGMPWLNGAADWPPVMQHTAYGDPMAGLFAAAALLTALYGRPANGGATIDLSQVECLFQLCADGIVAQSATGTAPPRTGNQRVAGAWRDCVACLGAEDWLAVDLPDADAVERTRAAIGAAPGEIGAALAAWAGGRSARDAAGVLQRAGIAAAPAQPAHALLDDPALVAAGFWRQAERRYVGTHLLSKAPFALDGAAPPLRNPTPTLGEHNAEVLRGVLGLGDAEVASLERDGMIGTRPA